MKKEQKTAGAQTETQAKNFRYWKSGKHWLYSASALALLLGGNLVSSTLPVLQSQVAEAITLPSGVQEIGSVSGIPLYKSGTGDTSSSNFQSLVDAIVQSNSDKLQGAKYVASQIEWTGETKMVGSGTTTVAGMGGNVTYFFARDGYAPTDQVIQLTNGQSFGISNVGYITDVTTGEKIKIGLTITANGTENNNGSDQNLFAVRNAGSVIHILDAVPYGGGNTGGGLTENGGSSGGNSGGMGLGYIKSLDYTTTIVRMDNGQAIPDDQLVVAQKVSDIDASQKVKLVNKNALGVIVSPDTKLTVDGDALRSTTDAAVNADDKNLDPTSFFIIKRYNSIFMHYEYTDGLYESGGVAHVQIDTAQFGHYYFEVNLGGHIKLDKSTVQYGKNAWNGNYSFDPLAFDVVDKSGKVVETLELDGNGKSNGTKLLPAGDYILREKASDWRATGQTQHGDIPVHVDAGKTTTVSGDQLKNTAVTGSISIDKTADGNKQLMNNLYSYAGLQFSVKSTDGRFSDTITLGADGKGTTTNPLPLGEYNVQEIDGSVQAPSGMVVNPQVFKVSLTYKDKDTALVFSNQGVDNKAVKGQITVKKSGVESGTDLWNGNYSLSGNQFKVTSITDGKVYTITTDAKGIAKTDKIPLGRYRIEEVKSSDGFVNTFGAKEVTLTYKDNKTELVFGETSGTNQEVKGQNLISKEDKETGKVPDGKGNMKTAKYALYYGDNSTGSAAHQTDQAVKWSDIPKAKLLAGEKVTSAVVNGTKVDYGDKVVVDVSDDKLEAAIGNLALGKYYWREVDAGEGYSVDPDAHPFEIKKKDDQTSNIITPNTKSAEQLIKAKISIQKLAEIAGESAESGYNDVEFTATPLKGTTGNPVKMVTGIDPKHPEEDGYASMILPYGDWVIQETKGIDGYEAIKDIYLHMSHDTKTDLLTLTASYKPDFSAPFSTRTFVVTDDANSENPNAKGQTIAGKTSSDFPLISLATIRLTDKTEPPIPPVPSVDIEKANEKLPAAGKGNLEDEADNDGENDHDTKETAFVADNDKTTPMKFKVTNNGEEALSHLKLTDRTTEGKAKVKSLVWTYPGKVLKVNVKGELEISDGKLLVLPVAGMIEGTGTLEALDEVSTHIDQARVTGIGVESKKTVEDKDDWHGKNVKPSIDVEKANDKLPDAGKGNHTDKADNAGENDHDTQKTAFMTEAGKEIPLFFRITNNGLEALDHVKPVDKTIDGKVEVQGLSWTYKGETLTLNESGELVTSDGRLFVLPAGDFIEASGKLPGLPEGTLHSDEIMVGAVGVESKKSVGDKDQWYGKTPEAPEAPKPPEASKPGIDIEKFDGSAKDVEAGQGNNSDKDNNLGETDRDTKETALKIENKKTTEISFKVTNNETEALTDIRLSDKAIEGKVSVKDIVWEFPLSKDGVVLGSDGKPLILLPGESFTGKGTLPELDAGELHGDEVTVTAVGVTSKQSVEDKDKWYGKVEKENPLPLTGEEAGWLLSGIGALLIAVIGVIKRKAFSMFFSKFRKEKAGVESNLNKK
ncbi:hypothetical protein OfM1_05420 [Lactovum odontotermitis]